MKYVLIILAIILLILAGIGYVYYTNLQNHNTMFDDIHRFDEYLRNGEYDMAKETYTMANNNLRANYNITLDTYTDQYLLSITDEHDIETVLDHLYGISEIGYTSENISRMIKQYEDILVSNYSFQKGMELYLDNDYDRAMECLEDVISSDVNYETATQIRNDYYNHELVFQKAKDQNLFGRNPLPNALATQDKFIYIPYIHDSAYCILKINTQSLLTQVFPIISTDIPSKIDNLNIIGEYIYFTYTQTSSSAQDCSGVYRIKTTGTALQKVSDTHLLRFISYGDRFYGVTSDGELAVYDSYFIDKEVLYTGNIRSMQVTDEGIYIGVEEGDDANPDVLYYRYDFEKLRKISINQNKNRLYQVYNNTKLTYYDYSKNSEWLYLIKSDHSNQYINIADIANVYALVDHQVLYTIYGDYYQECINVFDIEKDNNIEIVPSDSYLGTPIGVCYQESKVLLENGADIYLVGLDFVPEYALSIPSARSETLQVNQDIITKYGINNTPIDIETDYSYQRDGLYIDMTTQYMHGIEAQVYVTEIVSDSADALSRVDEIPSGSEYPFYINISMHDNSTTEDNSFINNILTQDAMIIDTSYAMHLYRSENLISKDILTYDDVHVAIESGYAVLEDGVAMNVTALPQSNCVAFGMISQGHYIVIASDDTDEDNKPLSPYLCGRLLRQMGCVTGFCYVNTDIEIGIDSQVIFDSDPSNTTQSQYLLVK